MRRRQFLVASLMSALPSARSQAQNWPAPVTRFVVPYAPGSAIDTPARLIAERLTGALAATFIVENRPGAGGAVGAQAVAQAAADGSVFLFTSSSVSILPALHSHLGFDPLRDLSRQPGLRRAVGAAGAQGGAASPTYPTSSPRHVQLPGRLTYGSGGVGSSNHLAGALFASLANIDIMHIPYAAPARRSMLSMPVEIDLIFAPSLDVLRHVSQGQLAGPGITLPHAFPRLPDVPAIAEFVAGYAVPNWFAIFAPAHLPASLRATAWSDALAPLRDWPRCGAFRRGRRRAAARRARALAKRMAEEAPQVDWDPTDPVPMTRHL